MLKRRELAGSTSTSVTPGVESEPCAQATARTPGRSLGAAALTITDLSKSFGATRALENLNLTVVRGEVRALVGENGSGKSTLIKILCGFYVPEGGAARVGVEELAFGNPVASHRLGLRFVHQNLALADQLSIADNIAMTAGFETRLGTIRGARLRAVATGALETVGLSLDVRKPVGELSPAERTGVAVARALVGESSDSTSVLVLDEPTATLADDEVSRLLQIVRTVRDAGAAVLYVTHRLEEIFRVADAVTVLRDGKHVATVATSGLSRTALIDYLSGPQLHLERRSADAAPVASAPVLRVGDLTAARLRGVSCEVNAGEILGVAGITGSGRENLCAAVFGAEELLSGTISVGDSSVTTGSPRHAVKAGVCYVSADRARDGGFMGLPARETLSITNLDALWRFPAIRRRVERQITHEWFSKLRVRPSGEHDIPLGALSGGNQQKVVFAKWLQREPRLMLLDEPTQGVDVATKAVLHDLLSAAAARGTAILVSSSDTEELAALCHRVIVLRGGRVAGELRDSEVSPINIQRLILGKAD